MSDSRVTDQTVRRRFPYPIAAAWHRVTLATTDADRINGLIACNEILLRTLAAFLLPDYLRGAPSPAVEAAIRKLERPTDGMWIELIRETLRHLGQRPEPQCFLSEAPRWFFGANGGQGEGARQLNTVVELRNRITHKSRSAVSPTQTRQQLKELHQAVWAVLLGLGWLASYRPFRVRSQEPARRRGSTGKVEAFFTGKLQFFAGAEEQSELQGAEWDAFLLTESVYLGNTDASGVLELTPFLQVLPHPQTNQEHLYLFRSSPGLKRVTRVHDESGSEIPKAVGSEEGEVSFERWLMMRERLDFFQELRIAGGAIRLARQAEPGEETGELSPRYQKLEELGRGGMATVYRVRDLDLDEEVALKVLNRELAEEATYCERFRREARRMLRIHHPRIVPAADLGTLPSGQPFLKMPVLRNGSLHDQVRPGGLPEERVRAWAEDALEALACIHGAGIVHRDIKPSNFLLDAEGRACLTDFGIALTPEDIRLTRTLEQMGTLAYMAPEQRTQRTVTERADIFSLAVVLHELRTGELPSGPPGTGIAGSFGELVRWMGEPDPDDRPSVAEALRKLRGPDKVTVPLELAALPLPAPETAAPAVIPASPGAGIEELQPTPARVPEEEPAVAAAPRLGMRAVHLKRTAVGMLLLLFVVNYVETAVESWLRSRYRLGIELEQVLGEAAQWFERGLNFEPHDATNMIAVWGFSTVYFFVFPLLVLATVVLFYRRRDPRLLLLLATAATIDYLLTLPFYILFPVPERWTFPDSGAVLLSDLWTSALIQAFRPFSGLNNCFPSFHVSVTVVLVGCLYRADTWFRRATLPLGFAIVLSTFVLGIHWLPDILAGLACGLVSFRLAERLLPRVERMIGSFQGFGVPRAR
ncbi:MAG TPA: protein kinase [Thermoanaerobaculia bacterium]|nr:protein kinase [Thermoanaerobaculia bacterium]